MSTKLEQYDIIKEIWDYVYDRAPGQDYFNREKRRNTRRLILVEMSNLEIL